MILLGCAEKPDEDVMYCGFWSGSDGSMFEVVIEGGSVEGREV